MAALKNTHIQHSYQFDALFARGAFLLPTLYPLCLAFEGPSEPQAQDSYDAPGLLKGLSTGLSLAALPNQKRRHLIFIVTPVRITENILSQISPIVAVAVDWGGHVKALHKHE